MVTTFLINDVLDEKRHVYPNVTLFNIVAAHNALPEMPMTVMLASKFKRFKQI